MASWWFPNEKNDHLQDNGFEDSDGKSFGAKLHWYGAKVVLFAGLPQAQC